MTRCIVLDIETRVDRAALAATKRGRAPSDMPPPLQIVTAAATMTFERDPFGRFERFRLASQDGPEAVLASTIETQLASVYAGGGDLVTYNGAHDLTVLRFALLRGRIFGGRGVDRWLGNDGNRHQDLMRKAAGDDRWPRLVDLAAGLGFAPSGAISVGDLSGRAKAEQDVALTMLVHIHFEAERLGDVGVLVKGAVGLGRYLLSLAMQRPHIAAILNSPLYANASTTFASCHLQG